MKRYQITENNITYDVVEHDSGTKFWFLNDKIHRENGPAVVSSNGYKEYWHNGKWLRHINSNKYLKRYIKLQSIA